MITLFKFPDVKLQLDLGLDKLKEALELAYWAGARDGALVVSVGLIILYLLFIRSHERR